MDILPNDVILHIANFIPEMKFILRCVNRAYSIIFQHAERNMELIAARGYVEILKEFLLCKCDLCLAALCHAAIINNHVNVLEFIHAENMEIILCKDIPTITAQCGHCDVLEFLHKINIKLDADEAMILVENNHLEALRWMHKNIPNCIRNWYACTAIRTSKSFDIICFLLSVVGPHVCSIYPKMSDMDAYLNGALANGRIDVAKYLYCKYTIVNIDHTIGRVLARWSREFRRRVAKQFNIHEDDLYAFFIAQIKN